MSHEVISIAGFDPFLTEELSHGSSLKRVQVILTQAPNEQWIAFFESSRHAAKHKASVEAHVVANYIAFESPADAIERHANLLAQGGGHRLQHASHIETRADQCRAIGQVLCCGLLSGRHPLSRHVLTPCIG